MTTLSIDNLARVTGGARKDRNDPYADQATNGKRPLKIPPTYIDQLEIPPPKGPLKIPLEGSAFDPKR